MNILFKTIVGSYTYGTYIEGISDIDYKGVYIQKNDDILTFKYKEQIDLNKDEVYYEVRRFLQLLQTANPTMLEMLYMPDRFIIEKNPAFDIIVSHRDKFLTQMCINSFGGYAISQIRKARGLDKKINWEKDKVSRKTPLDFIYVYNNGKTIPFNKWMEINDIDQKNCGLVALDHFKDCYALYYYPNNEYQFKGIIEDNSNSLRLSSVPKGLNPKTIIYYNSDGYSTHCKDYREYLEWIEKRNVNRYIHTKNTDSTIDAKNMLHCRRLLDVAKEIATEKTIRVERPNADYLLKIRHGLVDLSQLINEAEKDISELDELYKNSGLPDKVDFQFVNDLLLEVRNFYNKK